jgi:hypothetical protein
MSYENVKNSRKNLKRRLVYIMGDQCCICGYNKAITALEFHHKDPSQKDFALSSNANIGFDKANEEIRKCILVCSNCHREIHEFNIDVSQINCYDESKAQEVIEELDKIKHKTLHYCKDCGKIISSKATYCQECNYKHSRITERPSKEELKDMIRRLPFTQIANQYKVSDNAVRKWCDRYNLPKTKKEINGYSDIEWEQI